MRNTLGWTSVVLAAAGLVGIVVTPLAGRHDGLNILVLALCALSAALGGVLGLVAVVLRSKPGVVASLLAVASVFTFVLKRPPIPLGNESGAMGDLRSISSAEAAYENFNEGRYDTIECLQQPTRCIPRYPSTSPGFLNEKFLVPQRHGYEFSFHRGEPAPGAPSSSAMKSFAYVAVPIEAGRTGQRAFCIDAEGLICITDGRAPMVVRGECVRSAESGCIAPR